MKLPLLYIAFTPIAMVIVGAIPLIIYGIKAIAERRRNKKIEQKRYNSLAVYIERSNGRHNGYNYVDLGLPSHTLWATCNVGARNPGEPGFFFRWGSTHTQNMNKRMLIIPRLDPQHDAATVNWGSPWRTPSNKEVEELINSCKFLAARYNNIQGVMAIGPNQNTLFLPFTGIIYDWDNKRDFKDYGEYWTSEEVSGSEIQNNYSDYEIGSLAYSFGFKYNAEIEGPRILFKNHRITVRPVFSVMRTGMMAGGQMESAVSQISVNPPSKNPIHETPPPLPTENVQYYVVVNRAQHGPYDINFVTKAIQNGKITKDQLVWKEGMANWAKAATFAEFSSLFNTLPPIPTL